MMESTVSMIAPCGGFLHDLCCGGHPVPQQGRWALDILTAPDPLQIINISSTLGSIGTLQDKLGAEEDSWYAELSHYGLAYRSSKAALNMREPRTLPLQ